MEQLDWALRTASEHTSDDTAAWSPCSARRTKPPHAPETEETAAPQADEHEKETKSAVRATQRFEITDDAQEDDERELSAAAHARDDGADISAAPSRRLSLSLVVAPVHATAAA